MKMFKLIFPVLFVLVAAMSCNPLEDTFNDIEEITAPSAPIEYTFTTDNYAAVAEELRALKTVEDSLTADYIESSNLITSEVSLGSYLKEFVAAKYPQWGVGTSVLVSYNYTESTTPVEIVEDFSEYSDAPVYELTADDYEAVGLERPGFFFPTEPADAYLEDLLLDAIQDAIDGDFYAVTYEESDEDTVYTYFENTDETLIEETYDENIDGYFTQSVNGDQAWKWASYSGDGYAYMSGFSSGAKENEDWLVLSNIDLSDASAANIDIYHAVNYLGDGSFGEHINVLVSSDFDGADVTGATWEAITPDQWPTGTSWTFVNSVFDLTKYSGSTISVAFYYESTLDFAPGWELSEIYLSKTIPGEEPVLTSAESKEFTKYFEYNGSSWSAMDNVYVLSADDYNSMGAPGRYDNFSSSAEPEDYLPAFLTFKYPYAQEGDEYIMVYKYYSDGVRTIADNYIFSEGEWVSELAAEEIVVTVKTDQVKRNSSGWAFDPSVELTMNSDDYQVIVDYVISNLASKTSETLVDGYETAEFYYGASAYYVNFDIRATQRTVGGAYEQAEYAGLSSEEVDQLILDRMVEGIDVFLENKYNKATTIEGIDVIYTVTSAYYAGDAGSGTHVTVWQVTGPAQFELIEGPTKQE